MKSNRQLLCALLTFSCVVAGCDDTDSDSTDASVTLDGAADTSIADSSVKVDSAKLDGSVDTGVVKDGATDGMMTITDAGADSDAAVPPSAECSAYCDAITTNCTGTANEQYKNKGACISTCQNKLAWPAGVATATSGNTVGCRTYHATAAAGNATLHCPHAGPTGAATCGGLCENYCYIAARYCTGGNKLYNDDAACMTACAGFATTGTQGATGGNSLQCRLYHVNAAGGDPALHCPHSGVTPTAACTGAVQ